MKAEMKVRRENRAPLVATVEPLFGGNEERKIQDGRGNKRSNNGYELCWCSLFDAASVFPLLSSLLLLYNTFYALFLHLKKKDGKMAPLQNPNVR